jgi:hypothetical protein
MTSPAIALKNVNISVFDNLDGRNSAPHALPLLESPITQALTEPRIITGGKKGGPTVGTLTLLRNPLGSLGIAQAITARRAIHLVHATGLKGLRTLSTLPFRQ